MRSPETLFACGSIGRLLRLDAPLIAAPLRCALMVPPPLHLSSRFLCRNPDADGIHETKS